MLDLLLAICGVSVELIFVQAAVLGFPGYRYRPAASEAAISKLERLFGHQLLAMLKAIYRLHDGEVTEHGADSPALFFWMEFISLE